MVSILIVVLIEKFFLYESIAECVVILIRKLSKVVCFTIWSLSNFKLVNDLLEFGRNHELEVVTFELLEPVQHEWDKELLK